MDRILPLVHNWGNIEYSNPHSKMKKNLTIEPLTQNVKTCKKTMYVSQVYVAVDDLLVFKRWKSLAEGYFVYCRQLLLNSFTSTLKNEKLWHSKMSSRKNNISGFNEVETFKHFVMNKIKKRTNNNFLNTTQKTKDWATHFTLNQNRGEPMHPGRVSSSYSTSSVVFRKLLFVLFFILFIFY
jgi:hypothetical protein